MTAHFSNSMNFSVQNRLPVHNYESFVLIGYSSHFFHRFILLAFASSCSGHFSCQIPSVAAHSSNDDCSAPAFVVHLGSWFTLLQLSVRRFSYRIPSVAAHSGNCNCDSSLFQLLLWWLVCFLFLVHFPFLVQFAAASHFFGSQLSGSWFPRFCGSSLLGSSLWWLTFWLLAFPMARFAGSLSFFTLLASASVFTLLASASVFWFTATIGHSFC